jgi:cytochrome c peroxidase
MRKNLLCHVLLAAVPAFPQALGSLKTIVIPTPTNLDKYVRDQNSLVVLGKALFWDMQLGSDNRIACATCHFHAGADHRAQNQLSNPKAPFPSNYELKLDDFPFRLFNDAGDNRSGLLRDSGRRSGSAGVFRRIFSDVSADGGSEDAVDAVDTTGFSAGGLNVRQVTPRNTPSVINAVFNVRNLWDGRASDIFTGASPFGDSDRRANAIALRDGQIVREQIRIDNSSLASQAVGPPMNDVEMSYQGRTWPKLGKRVLPLRPLALQRVDPDDSVLGSYADAQGPGLSNSYTYLRLVQLAFQPEYWQVPDVSENFSLFFGLAVQAYQATLVSDDSPVDRFFEGDSSALTAQEQSGLRLFQSRGECTDCHRGPEFTEASFSSIRIRGRVRSVRNGLLSDTGFFHTGVRPASEDPGLDDKDDFAQPFSLAAAQNPDGRLGISGAFKTPGVRNVEFTGPYFHNGGQATLEQVVEFYHRGGDFPEAPNLSPDVRRLNLNAGDRAALVAFMKALSDDRVRFERAPFDHPELCIPVGHDLQPGGERYPLSAVDRWAAIPAVGRKGNQAPLQTFEELLQGIGNDGSRSHTLRDVCAIP